jgi:hypothetical protein
MRSTVTRREGPEITSARSGVPTHSVGRASDRGTPEVARQHRAPPGSRTTTVLPPRRERPRNRPHEIGGCRPRREGPRNRPHQIGGCRPRRGEPRNRPHQIGGAGGGSVTTPRSGCPESMRLALDILEGQNFARKNHHGVGPRRAGGSGACRRRCARQRQSICPNARQRDGGWPNVSAVWVRDLGEHWGALLPPR